MPVDLVILRPGEDRVRGELRAVIGDNHARLAAAGDQRRQLVRNTPTGEEGLSKAAREIIALRPDEEVRSGR